MLAIPVVHDKWKYLFSQKVDAGMPSYTLIVITHVLELWRSEFRNVINYDKQRANTERELRDS